MKKIYEIHTELLERMSFRTPIEKSMFNECVESYYDERYYSSCTLGMVIYEKIFFSRLHTLTYLPDGFIPSTENVKEHIEHYLNREREIIDGNNPKKVRGLNFYEVTSELTEKGVLTKHQKKEYDEFYQSYRIPVQHGLTLRLYEKITDREVVHLNEVDMMSEIIHKRVSELVIRKIYDTSKVGGIWG